MISRRGTSQDKHFTVVSNSLGPVGESHRLRGSQVSGAMAFALLGVGQLPIDPVGFLVADWPHLVGDIPTLGRGIYLAMPCVGLGAWSSAMAAMRWPGPYIVKHGFDIDLEVANPGAVFRI